MILFHLHYTANEHWRNSWNIFSPLSNKLHQYFVNLTSTCQEGVNSNFNFYRDQLQDLLSQNNPLTCSHHGHVEIDVTDLFKQLSTGSQNYQSLAYNPKCTNNCQINPIDFWLPTTIHTSMIVQLNQSHTEVPNTFTIQDWINIYITHQNKHQSRCPTCTSIFQTQLTSFNASPFFFFTL